MIRPGGWPRRGLQMSATPDSTLAKPEQLIADLRRQLTECKAERDEALAERDEALEQQIATTEVLQVINSSPSDLAPVFDSMLEKAMHLCEAAFGQLSIFDGQQFHTVAHRGVPAAFAEHLTRRPRVYGPGTAPARMLAGERVIYNRDLKDDDVY